MSASLVPVETSAEDDGTQTLEQRLERLERAVSQHTNSVNALNATWAALHASGLTIWEQIAPHLESVGPFIQDLQESFVVKALLRKYGK